MTAQSTLLSGEPGIPAVAARAVLMHWTVLDRLTLVLLATFAVEIIVGGPGLWLVGGVGVRRTLFVLSMVALLAHWLLGSIRLTGGELAVTLGVGVTLVVWVLLVPQLAQHNPALSFQDGAPLATAWLGVLAAAFFRTRFAQWEALKRIVGRTLAVVAVLNIALWAVGMSGDGGDVLAQLIALYWFTLGQLDLSPPLYVGLMPDGFFRAMWITAILYVPALMFCLAARRPWGVVLFGTALLVTYTRSLWLATAIALVLAQVVSRPDARFFDARAFAIALLGLASVAASLLLFAGGADGGLLSTVAERVATTFSDTSADERYEQVEPLISAWQSSPLWGKGFGAAASLIRSDDAPYSYELTMLALLMKMGIVGVSSLVVATLALWASAWSKGRARTHAQPRRFSAALASIVALLLAGSTNPFLLNFVGMSALSFLFVSLHLDARRSNAGGAAR